ncbi:MAG TPA: DUF6249 domain-containing protein [Rhodanobacteraceae bacterium]|nr:DUF6249 domain-containing protein [Rhodanobacteraceae bacterium]
MEILVPFIALMAPVFIVLIVFHYRGQQTQARYRMLLKLAEKGLDLPPQLLVEPRLAYCERRRALVLIGGGIGLMAVFLSLPGELGSSVTGLWGLGLLPLMIGLGYLASWWLNRREHARD